MTIENIYRTEHLFYHSLEAMSNVYLQTKQVELLDLMNSEMLHIQ